MFALPIFWLVVVCNSGEDASREHRHLELLEEQRVRGVLITPVDEGPNSRLEQLIHPLNRLTGRTR